MAKGILTVFYSDSGDTKRIADDIAAALSTTLERVTAPGLGRGTFGFLTRAWTALRRKPVAIDPQHNNPADFDLVIIGSPLWVGRVSSPVRAYLARHRAALNQVAFFVSAAGSNADGAFDDMRRLCGKEPIACLAITNEDRASGADIARIHDFADSIENRITAIEAVHSAKASAL